MSDDKGLPREMVEMINRFWRLLQDEEYQNETQKPLTDHVRETLGFDPLSRSVPKVSDLSKLGSLEFPIAVNGVYGEIAYLSLLRTSRGSPLAFHRVGSVSGQTNRLDIFELVSLDLSIRVKLHLNLYYKSRTRQAPKGFKIASEFLRSNPIFGTHEGVDEFPMGISQAVRDLSWKIYGSPAPVNELRQFEGLLSQR